MKAIHLEAPSAEMFKTPHHFDGGWQGGKLQANNMLHLGWSCSQVPLEWWNGGGGDRLLAGHKKQGFKNVNRLDPGTHWQDGISGISV